LIFKRLVSCGGLICVIVQNFSKIGKNFFGDIVIYHFQDVHHPLSLFFKNFWSTIRWGSQICITVTNFTKIGQTIAEISHLTFFKMVAVRHLGFLKI